MARRKNGHLELRFNEDRTLALVSIYPPESDGDQVTVSEVLERLKALGVSYGIRDQAILDAVHLVEGSGRPVLNIVAAQGTPARDGQDARVNYGLPLDVLARPLPRRMDGSGLPDWFALDPEKMVRAETELASITPAQPGTVGKTLTWPIQSILPKPGKPCMLATGDNVRVTEGGLRMLAQADGYACLQADALTVHALQQIEGDVQGGMSEYPAGAIFLGSLSQTQIIAHGFIAVQGDVENCQLRAHGDVFLHSARNVTLIATGTIYVTGGLIDCSVVTPEKVIALDGAPFVGGRIVAMAGIEAAGVGTPEYTPTQLQVGLDEFTPIRAAEIEEELRACAANIARISQTLKAFTSLAAQTTLSDDKRQLLSRLQEQKRVQEERVRELHGEKRLLSMIAKGRSSAFVTVRDTAYPGVWVAIGGATMQVEAPLMETRFELSGGGRSVVYQELQQAA